MVRGKTWKVSRFAWHLTMGPIPDGKWVLHRCDTPACCNPEHLFLGTQFDNMRDMVRKGRHWTRVKPHRRATGDRHGMRLHPERRARGVDRWNALLNPDLVREIRERASRGERHTEIAASVGVKRQAVQKVVARTTWAHVA